MATIDPLTTAAVPVLPSSGVAHQIPSVELFEWRILLNNVSWETYERLLAEIENPGTRLTFDSGTLEIMSPISQRHERLKSLLSCLIDVLTVELEIPRRTLGSTTWKRRDLEKGIEADQCYYLTTEPIIRKKKEIDLSIDPPPDLAIEIENTVSAIDKLIIYALLRVTEVWRFDGEVLQILALQDNREYVSQDHSRFFPKAATDMMVQFIEGPGADEEETAWIKRFRQRVRDNLVK
jgi:Uma2 family endonuclease